MAMYSENEDKKSAQRAWLCFVCGEKHAAYEDYKKHIVEKHDPIREYISCPACEAPVRDLRLHYNAKHPNRVMPKDGPMKVSIWYDFKDGKRNTRKPKFKEGYFESVKMNKSLHYRSGWECEVYEILEQDNDVVGFFAEPFKVPYCLEGKWYEYVPDLRVNYCDGSVDIWEIKPDTQLKCPKNKAKWTAMKLHADNMGWRFTVITQDGIGQLRSKVRKQRVLKD